MKYLLSLWVGINLCLGLSVVAWGSEDEFGTFKRPFAVDSLWNSKPVNPQFTNFEIPLSKYFPAVQQGTYSTGVFLAKETDAPVKVYGYPERKGVWDPDSEQVKPFVTIPHWPKEVIPASGSDGHADIVDEGLGIIHSFWQLKFKDGRWMAEQYAWTRLDGRGWGDPAHYFQGARAAAVPSLAGIIRQHEIEDQKPVFEHALAISLTDNGLSPKPAYIFPATSADTYSEKRHFGQIPEGALLMLPQSFDESKIQSSPKMKKIVRTLKTYGAYVVDENYGTPYVIYVENGPVSFNLNRPKLSWDNQVADELNLIRSSLRQVASADKWINGAGQEFIPARNLNLLSMRGPWTLKQGDSLGEFDTLTQAVMFGPTSRPVTQDNYSGRGMQAILWARPKVGETFRFRAITTGGAKVSMRILDKSRQQALYQTKLLENGDSETFTWPSSDFVPMLSVTSGVGSSSSARAELIKISR